MNRFTDSQWEAIGASIEVNREELISEMMNYDPDLTYDECYEMVNFAISSDWVMDDRKEK